MSYNTELLRIKVQLLGDLKRNKIYNIHLKFDNLLLETISLAK